MSDETLKFAGRITGHCRECGGTFEITDGDIQRRYCRECLPDEVLEAAREEVAAHVEQLRRLL